MKNPEKSNDSSLKKNHKATSYPPPFVIIVIIVSLIVLFFWDYYSRIEPIIRSKVKWAISDLRKLQYAVSDYGNNHPGYPETEYNYQLPTKLTTPIEYLSSEDYLAISNRYKSMPIRYYNLQAQYTCIFQWCGPDKDYDLQVDYFSNASQIDKLDLVDHCKHNHYDPTNGMRSNGDLFRFGEGNNSLYLY